jgi:hypothetical protein
MTDSYNATYVCVLYSLILTIQILRSEHGGTSLSQTTIDAKVIALYSTLSQLLLDKYEQLALTDKSRTAAESAACIEATVQAVKAARAREREKHLKDEQLKKQVRCISNLNNMFLYMSSCRMLHT